MLELRAENRLKTSDNYNGVCCSCCSCRYGTMLRCQLCLDLFHCTTYSSVVVVVVVVVVVFVVVRAIAVVVVAMAQCYTVSSVWTSFTV